MIYLAITFILSFFLSIFFGSFCRQLAIKFNFLDTPKPPLKIHNRVVPYGGGIAIWCTLFFISLVFFSSYIWVPSAKLWSQVMIVGLWIVLMGALDDRKGLNARQKIIVQLIPTCIVVFAAHIRMDITFFPYWLNILLSIFWILAMTNAINLMDVLDGLATGVCCFSFLGLAAIGWASQQWDVATLSILISICLSGFLFHNFPPAQMFLGDAGSQFLGFAAGIITIDIGYTQQNPIALFVPILIFIIPLYDTSTVIYARLKSGNAIWKGSHDHLAHRLQRIGFSPNQVLFTLYSVTLFASLFGLLIMLVDFTLAAFIFSILTLWTIFTFLWIGKIRMNQES